MRDEDAVAAAQAWFGLSEAMPTSGFDVDRTIDPFGLKPATR
jgi:hypothetical protein